MSNHIQLNYNNNNNNNKNNNNNDNEHVCKNVYIDTQPLSSLEE